MRKYTKIKTFRVSEVQNNTLLKMKKLNVDVGSFIREAVKEKIDREYKELIKKPIIVDSFLKSLDEAIAKSKL